MCVCGGVSVFVVGRVCLWWAECVVGGVCSWWGKCVCGEV